LLVEHLIRSAETIRDWPVASEQLYQAIIFIREAMYHRMLENISPAEQSRVFSILSFAMPPSDESIPENILDQAAAYETALHEQLARQSCPECGDGICPTTSERPPS
jgi:hypothetical protein